MHNAVVTEFGGSLVDENDEAEGSKGEVGVGIPAGTTENGMELHNFHPRPQDAELTDIIGESSSYLNGTT